MLLYADLFFFIIFPCSSSLMFLVAICESYFLMMVMMVMVLAIYTVVVDIAGVAAVSC